MPFQESIKCILKQPMTHDHHTKHQIPASVESIKALAEKMFESTRASHDWEHTLRVYRLCEKIGKAEGADMEALLIAACLHDIGRLKFLGPIKFRKDDRLLFWLLRKLCLIQPVF